MTVSRVVLDNALRQGLDPGLEDAGYHAWISAIIQDKGNREDRPVYRMPCLGLSKNTGG